MRDGKNDAGVSADTNVGSTAAVNPPESAVSVQDNGAGSLHSACGMSAPQAAAVMQAVVAHRRQKRCGWQPAGGSSGTESGCIMQAAAVARAVAAHRW